MTEVQTVKIIRIKNNIPTIIEMNGHRYILQNPTTFTGMGKKKGGRK